MTFTPFFPDLATPQAPYRPLPTIKDVVIRVCQFYGKSIIEVAGSSRAHDLLRPRHVAMYLAHKLTGKSTPQIAQALARRDHTTILHAIKVIKSKLATDPVLKREIDYLHDDLLGLPQPEEIEI